MTLIERLLQLSETRSNHGVTFISSSSKEKFVPYSELLAQSLGVLYHLQWSGLKPGQELVFQIDDNETFVYTFWACLLGGIIPVPVSPALNDESKSKVINIWNRLNDPYLIAEQKLFSGLETYVNDEMVASHNKSILQSCLLVEEIKDTSKQGEIYKSRPSDIAFIQFSSGSTGDPKGVVLTHDNLLANVQAIHNGIHLTKRDIALSWMPLTHDMGLIGFHLTPLVFDVQHYLMPASLFLRKPALWVDKLVEHKANITASPNFGYQHFLSFLKPEKLIDWDLSHVRIIFNGAEPISADICDQFLSALAPCGLNEHVMFTVYGMAEACLGVTFPPIGQVFTRVHVRRNALNIGDPVVEAAQPEADTVTFIDVGYPIDDCEVRICDSDHQCVPEGVMGHIQIKGRNVTRGYYNNLEATQQVITNDGWLNTGDLGYMREGRLVITGRAKDILFVHGQNYYAHDLERVAEEVEGVEAGKTAVCGVLHETNSDQVVLFVMHRKDVSSFIELRERITRHLLFKTGIKLHEVIPIRNIPKTTSGKVQRYKLREQFADGSFASIIQEMQHLLNAQQLERDIVPPETKTEAQLLKLCQDILGIQQIGVTDSFFEWGGHSLKVMQLLAKVKEEFHVELSIIDVFNDVTLRALARKIDQAEYSEHLSIEAAPEQTVYPVSSAQKRMYWLSQLEADATHYNIPVSVVLRGKLDKPRLEQCFQQLIERHESLRTSFEWVSGEPVQVIHEPAAFHIEKLGSADAGQTDTLIRSFIRPFDVTQAPLIRAGLIETGVEAFTLIIDMHHIISDGVSVSILIKELARLYQGESLPAAQIQYKDFAVWQNNHLQSDQLQRHRAFWLDTLAGELPVLNMPADYARPSVQSFEGDSLSFEINEEHKQKLYRMAAETGTTLYMVLLAAYAVLLSKYTGQEDIIVGSPVAGRQHADLEQVVGMFVNTLVMRTYPQASLTYNQFLETVKQQALKAYEHQDYPFDELVEHLGLKRDMSRNPVFDTMFVLQNMDTSGVHSEQLSFEWQQLDSNVSKFDLTLTAVETDAGLDFTLEYSTKLFRRDTMVRFHQHFVNLLSNLADDAEKRLADLELVSVVERQQLLIDFNTTQADFPQDLTIHEQFEQQVKRTPEQIAIVFEDQALTYQELNERANQLARLLRSKGVGPDQIVGIMAQRSLEMMIGILGILKAGGAYLPVDPNGPSERIHYMLEDSNAAILLTHEYLLNKVDFAGEKIVLEHLEDICARHQIPLLSMEEEGELPRACLPHHLAYVIYTSGSTGRPKGVMIEHRSVINRIHWMQDKYALTNQDVLLQKTPFTFDVSVWELFWWFFGGAKLCLLAPGGEKDPAVMVKTIEHHKVTKVHFVPSMLNTFMEYMEHHPSYVLLTSLTEVFSSGEALTPYQVRMFHRLLTKSNGTQLVNLYGPTEATVDVTYFDCTEEAATEKSVPIGKPIHNHKIYIVNAQDRLQPLGVAGELCVAGVGLARGYVNLPELTAEKFVDNPFNPGERMYRTGDLARWLPGGTIEYLGRIDHQVKIRGFRIELGEIRNQLLRHEHIKETVVIAREDGMLGKALCAYFTAEADLSVAELRTHLAADLPDYMIPSFFVQLELMPLTPNGKINRKALLESNGNLQTGTVYVAPRNAVEEGLVQLWRDSLRRGTLPSGLEYNAGKSMESGVDIGIRDNYFELGGDSLSLIGLTYAINQTYQAELTVQQVLTTPTIEGIAKLLENRASKKGRGRVLNSPASYVRLNETGAVCLFCFPPILGYGMYYKALAEQLQRDNLQLYAFDYHEADDRIQRYADTIKQIQPNGPYKLFGHSAGGNVAFEVAKHLERQGDRVSDVYLVDSIIRDQPVDVTMDEIRAEATKVLRNLDEDLRDVLFSQVQDYLQYFASMSNTDYIHANIHHLYSIYKKQDVRAKQALYDWRELTRGQYAGYVGIGTHDEMLVDYVAENAAILRQLL